MTRPVAPAGATDATSAARGARVLVGIIGGGFLLLIAAFVGMIFFVHHEARLNAVGPIAAAPGAERGGVVFHGTANIWEVRGRLTQDAARQANFAIDLIGPTGQPAPADLALRLALEHADGTGTDPVPSVALTRSIVGRSPASSSCQSRWASQKSRRARAAVAAAAAPTSTAITAPTKAASCAVSTTCAKTAAAVVAARSRMAA